MNQLSKNNPEKLQLLSFPDCPNSPELLNRLKLAVAKLSDNFEIEEVDLRKLAEVDPRLSYGAPTILLNGADLMGQAPTARGALQCRIYPDGVLPSVEDLLEQLQSHSDLSQRN